MTPVVSDIRIKKNKKKTKQKTIRCRRNLGHADSFHHSYHRGARGVMVIVTGYGHGDTSSIPGQDWLHFT